jgi:type II secretory pathway pseudopilin PulG
MRKSFYGSRQWSAGPSKQLRRGGALAGFTIVETLIVLAIAGIILLLVLEVIPSLQRTARNNERKQDVSTILNAVSQYELKDSDNFPQPCGNIDAHEATCNTPISNSNDYFLQFVFNDLTFYKQPDNVKLAVGQDSSTESPNPSTGTVEVYNYQICYPNQGASPGGSSNWGADYNNVVALYAIEGGSGGYTSECQNI